MLEVDVALHRVEAATVGPLYDISRRSHEQLWLTKTWRKRYKPSGIRSKLLRNSQIGPYAFPVVRSEFTNWRDEQRAWRESCALFDQSHHMTDLYVEGPDALKLFSDLGVNSFKNFKVNQAKQFVACNHDGYVIGDAILFPLDEEQVQSRRPSSGSQLGAIQPGDRRVQRHGGTGRAIRS